jgi:CheY-like chemotaxis protein
MISTGLAGILAQRLLRKICPKCAKPVSPLFLSQHEEFFRRYPLRKEAMLEGAGCEHCYELGYRGRTGIYSYLEVTEDVSELIFSGASQETLARAARNHGFRELDEAAVDLVNLGVASLSEAKPYLLRNEQDTPETEVEHTTHTSSYTKSSAPAPIRSSSEPLRRPSILLVDDNQFSRKMLCAMLKNERVDVIQAENGREALDRVYECSPIIILCDISMPEMDGREFLEHMKGNKSTRDIPIIVLTSDDCEHTELDLLKLGAREFLSKRSSPDIIAGRVRNVLNSL